MISHRIHVVQILNQPYWLVFSDYFQTSPKSVLDSILCALNLVDKMNAIDAITLTALILKNLNFLLEI